MRRYLIILLCIIFSNIYSQQLSHKTANKVYREIISAIGNTNPREPRLEFSKNTKSPANYNPKIKVIKLENKVLEICYSFGEDSLNALSYILAHELGHHYRGHGWMNDFADINFSATTLDKNKNLSKDQHIKYEIEADIYAAFYAHIAGYDALSVADLVLSKIYSEYKLPDNLIGYPSLVERINIINKNRLDFANLRTMFDMANIAMSLGQYDYAQELYQQIINQGFTSREIYNNLGLCYVYQALALDVESTYFNLIIPFKMDLSTRLESQASTRDVFFPSELTMLLYDAKREFETAIRLDKNYFIARENLFFTDIALNYLGEHVSSKITLKDLIENNHTCEFCVKGHFAVVDKKINKANRLFKKGSSECAICEINTDFRKKQISKTKNYKKIRFDVFQEINGVDMYCKDFTSKDHDIYEKSMSFILGVKDFSNLRLIQLKKKIKGSTSCISIQEISTKEDKLKNSVDIYVDDDVDKILDNYKEVRIIHSANKKYISIVGQQLSFLIKDEKVSKWYSFVRIN